MSKRPITEDDLQAFVDSALSPERSSEVSDFLRNNAEAAARLASYGRQASTLRRLLDPITDEPVPSRLNLASIAAAKQPSPRLGTVRMAMAATMLLAVGATGGWMTASYSLPPTEGVGALALEASASYGAFASDTLRPVEVRADDRTSLQQFATATLGGAAVIPDLSKAGYRLMGGRVVPTTHGAGFMLMYDNDRGNRLVMLARHMIVDQDKPMVGSTEGNVSGWSWAKGGMGYSVVGPITADELHPIADVVRSQV